MSATGLCLAGLSVGHDGRAVVSDLSLEFVDRGLHLLLGRTGAGKTSLLLTLGGFLPALAGRVTRAGGPWEPASRICLAFQNPEGLFFLGTVGEEITFALHQRRVPEDEAENRGRAWLARWGLEPDVFWHRSPYVLSGGEQRRVALAACTVFLPEVILLDEPLAGLDREGRDGVKAILADLAREHLVLVVTHDPEPLLETASTVLLLEGGRGQWFSSPQAFLQEAVVRPEVFPLPMWYQRAVRGSPAGMPLPWPVIEAVLAFLGGGTFSPRLQGEDPERPTPGEGPAGDVPSLASVDALHSVVHPSGKGA